MTFEHDNIVPGPSAAALVEKVAGATRVHLPGGHVGAVVSRKASQTLWPAMASFWASHEPKRAFHRRHGASA